MEWGGMSNKKKCRTSEQATPVFEFQPFYEDGEFVYVPLRMCAGDKIRVLQMSREVMRQGVAQAMGFVGGNVIAMAQRVLKKADQRRTKKAGAGH